MAAQRLSVVAATAQQPSYTEQSIIEQLYKVTCENSALFTYMIILTNNSYLWYLCLVILLIFISLCFLNLINVLKENWIVL